MPADQLTAIPEQRVALIPNPWRDSLVSFLFGYAVTTVLLYFGLLWFAALHPAQSQLDPRMVAVINLIDSLFGWGVFLVPVSFSYRAKPSRVRKCTILLTGSAIALLITGVETWVLILDPRFRIAACTYIAAGILNALLASGLLLTLRRNSARENES